MVPLLKAAIFSSLWAFGLGHLEQPEIIVSRATDGSAQVPCKASISSFRSVAIHWYRQKPGQSLEHLLYVIYTSSQRSLDGKNKKFEASKNISTSTATLTINFLKTEDEATYYCSHGYHTVFGEGTKLIVTSEKTLQADISPKPTIFLPSAAETNLYKAGTYLCLLEKFFPDVIKIYWKEKDDNKILDSQQGNPMKTDDTYMQFSWLTVSGQAMIKEHRCIVKHENNFRGVDQEILFPPIKKASTTSNSVACVKDENDVFQQQLTNTCACYTYLLLLIKSTIHLAIVAVCLVRRTAVCDDGKTS
ncbi:TCR gamma alternate reading frame protein [Dipodomys spectabilis]|uniref:TCR gamma alternate reading frame protein n=1 Tax=Dipodomys spectabilis TaxID=105255 RepID=UPI001C53FEEB|nr:TCR gamma alternate reading frame protein [Dipodomys spectabilis]